MRWHHLTTTGASSTSGQPHDDGERVLVVVDSKSIVPAAGLTAGSTNGDVWAEQTYGDNPATTTLDQARALAESWESVSRRVQCHQHQPRRRTTSISRVGVSAADLDRLRVQLQRRLGVRGRDNADGEPDRQGSLRQFLQNANAVAGQNAMRFVPAALTNASGGGGSWWSIAVTTDLPVVRDAGTTIPGRVGRRWDDRARRQPRDAGDRRVTSAPTRRRSRPSRGPSSRS
jgi:hypothetical protein